MDDEPEDDSEVDEGPEEFDLVESGQELGEPCPFCRRIVYEDAERCPHCGHLIARGESGGGASMWIVITTVAVIGLILLLWGMRG